MLWFRLGAVVSLIFTLLLGVAICLTVLVSLVNPASEKAMNSDPFYNGTLLFYILLILAEFGMSGACIFGFLVAFKVWKNHWQLDHSLRELFAMWLGIQAITVVCIFILGLLGLVRYREYQEELVSLYEIFAKYNQEIKFVGTFESYQRENSCCGINGPDDWMMAQVKTSSAGAGYGGYDSSYQGSPSTGKCHLTPPTVPMGCGKKLLDEIHFTMSVFSGILILQTLSGIACAVLGWYCFFYWIEKEVIIIPEDEVSNIIVIEPETSVSTIYSDSEGASSYRSGSIHSGSRSYTSYQGSGSRLSYLPNSRDYLGSRFTYNGYLGSRSHYPNSSYYGSAGSKFSNFNGSIPARGGPHSAYLQSIPDHPEGITAVPYYPSGSQNKSQYLGPQSINNNSQYGPGSVIPSGMTDFAHSRITEIHPGTYGRSVYHGGKSGSGWSGDSYNHTGSYLHPSSYIHSGSYMGSSHIGSQSHHSQHSHHHHHVHKEHSKLHMLHKQEKALGGRVLAEMHVDHDRDPDPMNSQMDVAKAHHGHRQHHATIAIIKNKHPKKPKTLKGDGGGPGQTGHVAADIIDMSGGAAAVKSLIDDVNLPVEHDPHLTEGGGPGYVDKLHRAKKMKSQLDHPDPDHPGHGPIHAQGGKLSAPSIDGSQAQGLVDQLLSAEPKQKKDEPAVKPHDVNETSKKDHNRHHHHHDHHGSATGSHHHHHGHDSNHHHHDHAHHHGSNHHGSHHHHGHPGHSNHHYLGHSRHSPEHHSDHHEHHRDHHHHDDSHNHHDHSHHRYHTNTRGSLETEVLYKKH